MHLLWGDHRPGDFGKSAVFKDGPVTHGRVPSIPPTLRDGCAQAMQMDATLLQWIKMLSFFGAVFFSFMIGRTIEGSLLIRPSIRQAKRSQPDSGEGLMGPHANGPLLLAGGRGEEKEDAFGH